MKRHAQAAFDFGKALVERQGPNDRHPAPYLGAGSGKNLHRTLASVMLRDCFVQITMSDNRRWFHVERVASERDDFFQNCSAALNQSSLKNADGQTRPSGGPPNALFVGWGKFFLRSRPMGLMRVARHFSGVNVGVNFECRRHGCNVGDRWLITL